MTSNARNPLGQFLAQRIRHLRTEKNIPQSALAADLKLNPGHISNIEKGHMGGSSLTLAHICRSLGSSLSAEAARFERTQRTKNAYPKGLQELIEHPPIPLRDDLIAALASIEHNGKRIQKKEDFLLVYLILQRQEA